MRIALKGIWSEIVRHGSQRVYMDFSSFDHTPFHANAQLLIMTIQALVAISGGTRATL
jgi:hypothetical protein